MNMGIVDQSFDQTKFISWFTTNVNLPFFQIFTGLWEILLSMVFQTNNRDCYEVLNYESTLELHDTKGKMATFSKQKRIRYLQNNIIAFQDYAWGDGKILQTYQTNLGVPVDIYRSGYKTYILLSLREARNRGDIDEFNIRWNIHRGFLTDDGYWGTNISQRTKHVKVNIIFPKSRPPIHLSLEETNQQRTQLLSNDSRKQLPDGCWQITWEKDNPKLHELYVIRWIW